MKTIQRILIILGLGALIALVTWATVSVISIASMPTDTMDLPTPAIPNISIAATGTMGYIKPLIMITLVVVIEQFIEKLFGKKERRVKIANA